MAAPSAAGLRPRCRVKTNSERGDLKETRSVTLRPPFAGLSSVLILCAAVSGGAASAERGRKKEASKNILRVAMVIITDIL
jgi:hypothetical protein